MQVLDWLILIEVELWSILYIYMMLLHLYHCYMHMLSINQLFMFLLLNFFGVFLLVSVICILLNVNMDVSYVGET